MKRKLSVVNLLGYGFLLGLFVLYNYLESIRDDWVAVLIVASLMLVLVGTWLKAGVGAVDRITGYHSEIIPRTALFVAADRKVFIFPSLAAANADLSDDERSNGEARIAYNLDGTPYRAVREGKISKLKPVPQRKKLAELKSLLLKYLQEAGESADPSMPIPKLAAAAWAVEHHFWHLNDPAKEWRFFAQIPYWAYGGLALVILGATAFSYG